MRTANEIKELGLTKQRQVVLTVIMDSPEHMTANQVFERSKELLPQISFATVYNSLRFLKDAGHIAEVNFGTGATRYDRLTDRHDHAICSVCGKLVDIHLKLPKGLVEKAAQSSSFKPETLELTLRGLCPDCK